MAAMGLLDRQTISLNCHIADLVVRGEAKSHEAPTISRWPEGPSLVLAEDTALELGNPAVGSLSCVAWTDKVIDEDSVVVGGNPLRPNDGSLGLAQIVLISGRFEDEYESYLDIRDALRCVDVEGVSARALPGNQRVWYRLSRTALESGLTLEQIGAAIVDQVSALDLVDHVKVALIWGRHLHLTPLAELEPLISETGRIISALVKRNEEDDRDCLSCDFSDICEDSVML